MAILGTATKVSLDDSSPLFSVAEHRPEVARAAACLSLELANTAYSMDIAPWQKAGWRDFSLLADDGLLTGSMLNGPASPLGDLTRGVMQTLTRLRVNMQDPVTQYLGFKRHQDENANASKAVVVSRRRGTTYLVGIGFMGTGKRLFDWIPNLRFRPDNGYHGGFWRLADQFLEAAARIEFPETAKELHLSRLTLRDIFTDMKNPHSRFRLWACGHSQGAAVLQILFDRLIREGVLSKYLAGYGFASPMVTQESRTDAWCLPIRHILNADDMVPRVGANSHLGKCFVFIPNQEQQMEMYRAEWASPCFREMLRFYRRVSDTGTALIVMLAVLELVRGQSEDTIGRLLAGSDLLSFLPDFLRLDGDIGIPALNALTAQLREEYLAVTGDPVFPEDRLTAVCDCYKDMIARHGLPAWFRAALRAFTLPHKRLGDTARGEPMGAYQYIVTGHMSELIYVTDANLPAMVNRPDTLTE